MIAPLHPLRFQSLLKRYLWGGRRLGTVLGKALGQQHDYAESWEVADHGRDQSLVAGGPLAGMPLSRLVSWRGRELLGRHAPLPRFPLLFKYLDCHQNLSVQVHPNDEAAARLDPPDLGKTEAWLILDALPGSRVYAGLRPGVDRQALERAVREESVEACLHSLEPRVGDCIFIPAGTVHALGAGLLVAEIQQASDTTYRLFDWNRVGPDGQPRQLHVEQALATIDYSTGPIVPQASQVTPRPFVERLVVCDKFVLDRWRIDALQVLENDDRFHILSVLEGELLLGSASVLGGGGEPAADDLSVFSLVRGQTLLVPASARGLAVLPRGSCVLLDMYLP
jgi:mannose-6-phosphate isomerase